MNDSFQHRGDSGDPAGEQTWRELAVTDPLTGLPNRRGLDELITTRWSRWQGDRTPVAVLMIDIDHFKALNDAAGHTAGDSCLETVAKTLSAACSSKDGLVCRWGGEEFLAVLPGLTAAEAEAVGRRAVEAVGSLALPNAAATPPGVVTVSIGVAATEFDPGSGSPPGCDALIARADRALYAAKRAGRNRVATDAR